jgi:hypothetical protein
MRAYMTVSASGSTFGKIPADHLVSLKRFSLGMDAVGGQKVQQSGV